MQTEIRLTFQHSIRFTPINTTQGTCLRPMFPVRLSYGNKAIDVDVLVDTGADFSTFDKGIAKSLDIPDDQLILDQVITVQGMTRTWYCPLIISFMGKSFDCRCAFIENPNWPPALGRDTIFSRMQFAFRQSVRQFYLSLQP